jgi:hypothetical protein
LRRWPSLNRLGHQFWAWVVRVGFGVAPVRPGWQRSLYQAQCRWNLRLSVRDPELDSPVPVAEDQADYAMWWINQIRDGRVAAAAPTEVATTDYNESMKAAMPQTIWVTGCSSWYLGKDGLPELFRWPPQRHRELLRTPELADFDVHM